jgi:ornithine lipid ester-linked acyl 2-hydroxylase
MADASAEEPVLWYEILGGRYAGTEPYFFEPEKFPWTATLRASWRELRDEVEAVLAVDPDRLRPYFSGALVHPPRQWKTIGFYFWKWRLHANCDRYPRTMEILGSIPHLCGASVNVLEPGANIHPHQGDTNAQVKVHLALRIPAGLPECGFQVGPETRAWREGDLLLFCDAHRHTAWNHSAERRLILVLDVIRPEFAARADAICAHVLASSALQLLDDRLAAFRKLPGTVRHGIHAAVRVVARALLPFNRSAGAVVSRALRRASRLRGS